jgi:hypothetical protein
MAVSIDCDLDRTMAALVSYVGKAFALLDQRRREGVSQIVKANTSDLSIGKKLVEHLAQIAGLQRTPLGVVKSHSSMTSLTTAAVSLRSPIGFSIPCVALRLAFEKVDRRVPRPGACSCRLCESYRSSGE